VLRLLDARSGSYSEVRPVVPGLLRVCAHIPEATRGSGITGLRVLLVANLLARAAELGNLQVLTVMVTHGEFRGHVAAVEDAAGALGIHPPAGHASSGDAQVALGGPVDIHVSSDRTGGNQGGIAMCVGAAHMLRTGTHGEARAGLLAGHEHDPLAVRLALMSFPSGQPADLTASVLTGARDTVGDWQRRVARWAEQPSRPVPPNLAETVRAAFGDLDIPSAIALLRGLADDDSVPPGAKFETFLYVDRVLGLDLPRQIGKLS